MPGVAIHLLTLEDTITELKKRAIDIKIPPVEQDHYKDIVSILEAQPQFARLGSMGPDPFFRSCC